MSLLKITTTPIEYEIKIEHAKLQAKEQDFTEIKCQQAEAARRKTQLAVHKTDSDNARQVEQGTKSTDAYMNVARQRTAGKVKSTAAAAFSDKLSVDSSIAEIEKNFSGYNESFDFISASAGNSSMFDAFDSSQFVSSVKIEGMLKNENQWTISKNKLEFVPGRFHMEIIQYPKVTIEYLGNKQEENGE